ncbi:hypothetical protein ACTL6U_20010 [Rhodovibrionaceae bacterium A322]
MAFIIDNKGQDFFLHLVDDLDFLGMLEGSKQLWAHPDFDRHRTEVFDARSLRELRLCENEVTALAKIDSYAYGHMPTVKVAVLHDRDRVDQLIDVYRDNLETDALKVRAFRDPRAAATWLYEKTPELAAEELMFA